MSTFEHSISCSLREKALSGRVDELPDIVHKPA
jgi:hypothetical protein